MSSYAISFVVFVAVILVAAVTVVSVSSMFDIQSQYSVAGLGSIASNARPLSYVLEVDNQILGQIYDLRGGTKTQQSDGKVVIQALSFSFNVQQSTDMFPWLREVTEGKASKHNGKVIGYDLQYKEAHRITFTNAYILSWEVKGFQVNKSSKKCEIRFNILPEDCDFQINQLGQPLSEGVRSYLRTHQLPEDSLGKFQFELDNIDTSRIQFVKSIFFNQEVNTIVVDEKTEQTFGPMKMRDLSMNMQFPTHSEDGFFNWILSPESQAKTGRIVFTSSNGQEVVFSFQELMASSISPLLNTFDRICEVQLRGELLSITSS